MNCDQGDAGMVVNKSCDQALPMLQIDRNSSPWSLRIRGQSPGQFSRLPGPLKRYWQGSLGANSGWGSPAVPPRVGTSSGQTMKL